MVRDLFGSEAADGRRARRGRGTFDIVIVEAVVGVCRFGEDDDKPAIAMTF